MSACIFCGSDKRAVAEYPRSGETIWKCPDCGMPLASRASICFPIVYAEKKEPKP